jgi:hypothetical protein
MGIALFTDLSHEFRTFGKSYDSELEVERRTEHNVSGVIFGRASCFPSVFSLMPKYSHLRQNPIKSKTFLSQKLPFLEAKKSNDLCSSHAA